MTLPDALAKALKLVEASDDSTYSNRSAAELAATLRAAIEALHVGSLDQEHLSSLFGPTSALQEIAIDNGWGDSFLSIAATIDRQT